MYAKKFSNNLPLDLTFTKLTSNHEGDCFKFCDLHRKPELYLKKKKKMLDFFYLIVKHPRDFKTNTT